MRWKSAEEMRADKEEPRGVMSSKGEAWLRDELLWNCMVKQSEETIRKGEAMTAMNGTEKKRKSEVSPGNGEAWRGEETIRKGEVWTRQDMEA